MVAARRLLRNIEKAKVQLRACTETSVYKVYHAALGSPDDLFNRLSISRIEAI